MDPNSSGGLSPSGKSELDDYPVALAALILAAGAFVVAVAQALLQYFSSSEARGKCTYEAIDRSAKSTKLRWNWTFWKLRVYYPVLDLSFKAVMTATLQQTDHEINSNWSPLRGLALATKDRRWVFKVLDEKDTDTSFLTVSDGYTTLIVDGPSRVIPVTSKQLTWAETFRLVWWKLRHYAGPVNRPRASWAQMLMAFGIRNTTRLVYKHADADSIPTSLDAPIQRVNLVDLGKLALSLGFKKVTINAREREFNAVGDFGTITTLNTNELGKVLRFEGDILASFAQLSRGSILASMGLISGRLAFAPGIYMEEIIYPLHLLLQASSERWGKDRFVEEQQIYMKRMQQQEGLAKGQVVAEASLFDILYSRPDLDPRQDTKAVSQHILFTHMSQPSRNRPPSSTNNGDGEHNLSLAVGRWTTATNLTLPSIIVATSLCLITGCEAGYPSSALINPVMPWVLGLADQAKRSIDSLTHVSRRLTNLFKLDELKFVSSRDTFWYSVNHMGMNGNLQAWGWIFRETSEIYNCLDAQDRDHILPRGTDGKHTGEVQPVILTESHALIQHFDPHQWASKIERIVKMQLLKFRPHNMVWAQILLLDVAIHALVRGGFYHGHDEGYDIWTTDVVAVFHAVVYSWDPSLDGSGIDEEPARSPEPPIPPPPRSRASVSPVENTEEHEMSILNTVDVLQPTVIDTAAKTTTKIHAPAQATSKLLPVPVPEPTPPQPEADSPDPPNNPPLSQKDSPRSQVQWDLAGALRKQVNLFADAEPVAREAKVQKLACLLQLRALFVIALFMLMPDSSDVYLADGERVEMPMI